MMVKGGSAKGLVHIGKKNLGSIGVPLWWRDYRSGVELANTDQVVFWSDLGAYGYNMTPASGETTNRYIKYSDGIGIVAGAAAGVRRMRNTSTSRTPLKDTHDGSAHFICEVVYWDKTGANANAILNRIGGLSASSAGITWQILINGSLSHTLYSDAGTSLGNHASGASTVPDGQVSILMYTYYGSGGSNNSRITINSTNYITTRNPAFGTGEAAGYIDNFFPANANNSAKTKLSIAYSLKGKTVTQINDFVTNFLTTLKEDPEYSGLTTI